MFYNIIFPSFVYLHLSLFLTQFHFLLQNSHRRQTVRLFLVRLPLQPELQRARAPAQGPPDREAEFEDRHRHLRGRPQERGREVPGRRSNAKHGGHHGHRLKFGLH